MANRTLIIVVNFNKSGLLRRMLTSLFAARPDVAPHLVVVDNASTDDSMAMLAAEFPAVKVLRNAVNLGGTGGFNTGMKHALAQGDQYEFFWLLDNDVVVHPGALEALEALLDANKDAALAGSMVLDVDNNSMVQEVGARVVRRVGLLQPIGTGPRAALGDSKVFECDYVAACSCLARMSAVRKVGIWDPGYFLLWDDVEWGVRMRDAGWRVVSTTASRVEHENFDNRRARSPGISIYLNVRNQLYFQSQQMRGADRLRSFLLSFRLILTSESNSRMEGELARAGALRRAYEDFFARRVGAPPKDLPAPAPAASAPLPTGFSPKRVALLVRHNPEHAMKLYEQLSGRFPKAEIDCLILADRSQIQDEKLPRALIARYGTLADRLRLAARLASKYDLVAGASYLPPYLFERLVAWRARVDDQGNLRARAGGIAAVLSPLPARAVLLARALAYALRATMRKPVRVDYHEGIQR